MFVKTDEIASRIGKPTKQKSRKQLGGCYLFQFSPMKKCSQPKFKTGDKVIDTWYPEAGTGVITEVLKTRLKVYYERATFKGGWQCPLFRGAKENG